MNVFRYFLRVVFSLSVLACLVILTLFVRGRAEWSDAFWLQLVGSFVVLCVAVSFVAFCNGCLMLDGVRMLRFVLVFLRELVIVYVVFGVVVTVIVLAVIYGIM